MPRMSRAMTPPCPPWTPRCSPPEARTSCAKVGRISGGRHGSGNRISRGKARREWRRPQQGFPRRFTNSNSDTHHTRGVATRTPSGIRIYFVTIPSPFCRERNSPRGPWRRWEAQRCSPRDPACRPSPRSSELVHPPTRKERRARERDHQGDAQQNVNVQHPGI